MSNIFEQKLLQLIAVNLADDSDHLSLDPQEADRVARGKLERFAQKFFEKHKKEIMES